MGQDDAERIRRCDYCRLPIPGDPITGQIRDETYTYCSQACRAAQRDSETVFTQFHGYRRFDPAVSALSASLPDGIPRNSFVLVSDLAGTRSTALLAEVAWRAIQRGEPVVYVSLLEPPVSVVQEFADLEWNVLPALERGQLQLLDAFTYRLHERGGSQPGQTNDWNAHLRRVAADATTRVRDPTELSQLSDRLTSALDAVDAVDEGIVIVDSLTELGTLVQPVRAYDFLKDVRASVCKGRFVPIFAGATITGDDDEFPHDTGYLVDGVVEMRLNEEIVEGALLKGIRVRKMRGVLSYPEWNVYEYAPGRGLVTFDPHEEMAEGEGVPGGRGQGASGQTTATQWSGRDAGHAGE